MFETISVLLNLYPNIDFKRKKNICEYSAKFMASGFDLDENAPTPI